MPNNAPVKIRGLAFVAIASAVLAGCTAGARQAASVLTGGDSQRGRAAISKFGCGSCHAISGIWSAHGLVGPPLTGLKNRMYVAGVLPNTPDNLVRWIRNPKEVNGKTLMPVLGVGERDAADIAAYLYSSK